MSENSKTLTIPTLNPNDDSAKIIALNFKEGEYVEVGMSIAIVETSKTTVEIESNSSGYLQWHYAAEDYIKFGEVLASFHDDPNEVMRTPIQQTANKKESLETVLLSKEAKAFIEENNIDVSIFKGKGLVNLKLAKELSQSAETKTTTGTNSNTSHFLNMSIEKLGANKLAEIKMLESGHMSALPSSLTVNFSTNIIRQKLNNIKCLNKRILPYIIFVLVQQLKDYPKFTAYFNNNSIYYYNEINIGLAVDLGNGLKVIVMRDLANKSVVDIHFEILDCIAKYYDDSLEINDLTGSTITLSDLSNDNILYFQPLLNVNQSVIIGIGGDEHIENSPMSITAVFDHRVLSGQEVAEFLNKLKTKLLIEYNNISQE